jgi:hypothetical protein
VNVLVSLGPLSHAGIRRKVLRYKDVRIPRSFIRPNVRYGSSLSVLFHVLPLIGINVKRYIYVWENSAFITIQWARRLGNKDCKL